MSKNQTVPFNKPGLFPTRPTPPRQTDKSGLVAMSAPEIDEGTSVAGAVALARKAVSDPDYEINLDSYLEWLDFIAAVDEFVSVKKE